MAETAVKKDMGDNERQDAHMGKRNTCTHIPSPYYKLLKRIYKKNNSMNNSYTK